MLTWPTYIPTFPHADCMGNPFPNQGCAVAARTGAGRASESALRPALRVRRPPVPSSSGLAAADVRAEKPHTHLQRPLCELPCTPYRSVYQHHHHQHLQPMECPALTLSHDACQLDTQPVLQRAPIVQRTGACFAIDHQSLPQVSRKDTKPHSCLIL